MSANPEAIKHLVKMESFKSKLLFILHFICSTLSAPQQPEINDQFTTTPNYETKSEIEGKPKQATEETRRRTENLINITTTTESEKFESQLKDKPVTIKQKQTNKQKQHRKHYDSLDVITDVDKKPSIIWTLYEVLTRPINIFLSSPKVSFVMRNIGTCVVNGALEIISHYFPAPFIPLIASAAGMVIPFEPVVMLKEKMPVTSYRRAFRKAMSSFVNAFDAYKLDNFDEDPYMTRRFNRRFMNDVSGEIQKKSKSDA